VPRIRYLPDYYEPRLVAVDYVVRGPRTAAAVAAGNTALLGMNYQTSDSALQYVEAGNIPGVLHGLGQRPRVYSDAHFALAVEMHNDLPSLADIADVDDIGTMLCLLHGQDRLGEEIPTLTRANRVNMAIDRTNHPLALHARLLQEIQAAGLYTTYREIEVPVLAPVLAMTIAGLPVNRPVLEGIKEGREAQMEIARRQLREIAGRTINLDSAIEVAQYLYDELKLPVPAYTPNGNPSTSNKALQLLAEAHPAVRLMLRYQSHKPVRDAADALLAHLAADNRVYAELDPLGAATGRFSCREPNLQGLAAPVLQAVEAAPGRVLMEADYSQMELRVLAHFSQDAGLLQAFQHDIDLHRRTAARVLGIAEADVTDQQRQLGKTLNFGIVYGQTAYGLADELAIPMQQAEAMLAAHAAAFPGVTAWIAEVHRQVANTGEVRTLYGRRRYLPNIYSTLPGAVAEAHRQAVNTIIQGTAADVMKLALIHLHERLPVEVRMLLPVHDSILLEVPANLVEETCQIVKNAMQTAPAAFAVPLKVDIHTGRTWADQRPH